MFDVHCHIIPGIDDGAKDLEESLALIRMEVQGGTTGFVATPHVYNERDIINAPQIVEKAQELRSAVEAEGIPVEIHSGAEVYPMMNVIKAVDQGLPLTAGGHGKHMLIDLPMGQLPMDFGLLLFELKARGITPIIAHPERCGSFQAEPERIREYLDNGAACQINGASIRGRYGERAQEVAMMYLHRHWPHFLASDAHKPRPEPILAKAVAALRDELDPHYLELITLHSGRAIAYGEKLPDLPPAPPREEKKKTGFMGRLFGRGQ